MPARRRTATAVAFALTLLAATEAPSTRNVHARLYLPTLLAGAPLAAPHLGARLRRAAVQEDPTTSFPAYADGAPSPAAARANVTTACLDVPPLDDVFGRDAQAVACRVWTANALGNWHAARLADGAAPDDDARWAAAYLDVALDALAVLAYGPGEGPLGAGGLRDTRGAVWQNTARLVDIIVIADDLARRGALAPALEHRVTEMASAIARSWRVAWWDTGVTPSTGATLVTGTAAESPIASLAGAPVAPLEAHAFAWDADHGNSPAEEMAWMGAGVLLATRWLGSAIPPSEAAELASAGRHYAGFALSAGRRDPRTGAGVWTLGTEAAGGPYGQSPLWLENHQPDVPSIPYLGVAWFYLAVADLAWPSGSPRVWQPNATGDPWPVMRDGAEATIHAPDGSLLVDLTPGRPVDYALTLFPAWTMPCGSQRAGALYVATALTAPGTPGFVNEIGEPAGVALLAAAVPIAKAAAARGDEATAARWRALAHRVLDDRDRGPTSLAGLGCRVAPWTAGNPLYHRAAVASQLTSLWRVAEDRVVLGPPSGPAVSRRGDARGEAASDRRRESLGRQPARWRDARPR